MTKVKTDKLKCTNSHLSCEYHFFLDNITNILKKDFLNRSKTKER